MRTEAEVKRAIKIMEGLTEDALAVGNMVAALTSEIAANVLKWTADQPNSFGETLEKMARDMASPNN